MPKTDEKGRVLRQSELIAKDLEPILDNFLVHDDHCLMNRTDDYDDCTCITGDIKQNLIKQLTPFVLEQRAEDFFNGERVGLIQGRIPDEQ
jgi:hypothetical protein